MAGLNSRHSKDNKLVSNLKKQTYITPYMKCLNCGEPMVALELTRFEVDTCLVCGGIWLDSGELEVILGKSIPIEVASGIGKVGASKRKCPICNKKMVKHTIGTSEATEIDLCASDHGIWFDRGELTTVAESLQEPVRSTMLNQIRAIFTKEF